MKNKKSNTHDSVIEHYLSKHEFLNTSMIDIKKMTHESLENDKKILNEELKRTEKMLWWLDRIFTIFFVVSIVAMITLSALSGTHPGLKEAMITVDSAALPATIAMYKTFSQPYRLKEATIKKDISAITNQNLLSTSNIAKTMGDEMKTILSQLSKETKKRGK